MKLRTLPLSVSILTLFAVLPGLSQTVDSPRKITTPKQALGFNIGDDYYLANYAQLTSYWQTLAKESDRMKLVDIGPTAENRRQYMAIISSPENIAKLDHYKEISAKLARAENLTDAEAHALSEEGRAIVWIDGGLHASETVGAQQLVETVYQLNALTDPETLRFLHDVIVLCVLDNPDGMDLVSNWYMREPTPDKRVTEGPAGGTPRLWHHYIGHDDNRDFYMNNMPETTNISRILFREWYPQIMYNHHQTGPPAPSSSCHPSATPSTTTTTRSSPSRSKPSGPPCTSASSKRTSPAPACVAPPTTPPGTTAACAPSPTSTT